MRYATANWTILHTYKDAANVLRYRENGLVPKTSWHKPLIYFDDFNEDEFLWRNYIATPKLVINTKLHGAIIENQRALGVPPDAHENSIPINDPAIEQCNRESHMLAIQFQHGHQLSLTRKGAIVNFFNKLSASGKYPTRKEVVEELAARCCVSVTNMANTLHTFRLVDKTRNITHDSLSIDKRSKEYRLLQAALQRARNRAMSLEVPGTIHIEDLLTRHNITSTAGPASGLGHYASVPIMCPVLGIKLNLEDHKSPNSMAVWRKDVTKHFTKTNVCVMSNIASRLIEGTADIKKAAEYLATLPGAGVAWQQWCATHVTGKKA